MRTGRVLPGLLLTLLVGCGSGASTASSAADPAGAPERAAGWSAVPASPLSPRHEALQLAVGTQALLLGGQDEPLCPPGALCVRPADVRRDAAAYDVRAQRWRSLAPAPAAISAWSAAAVEIAGTVYVHASHDGNALLGYDVAGDAWEVLPAPPDEHLRLVAAGDVLVGYAMSQEGEPTGDWLYTPAERRWSPLPQDPLFPSFDRAMVWTGERLVLVGAKVTPSPGGEDGPSWLRAATFDLATSSWTALPESRQVIVSYVDPVWTGSAVLNAAPGGADGGEINGYGRTLPFGGFLDPDTGQWSALPATEGKHTGSGFGPSATSRDHVARGEIVLDVRARRWIELPSPPASGEQGATSVWVDGSLLVWGGGSPRTGELVANGALWTPPRR